MMRFALLYAGFVPPSVTQACELGYGQGMTINIHAAAEPVSWAGTDFNPVQAAFAQELANVSGAQAHCYAESFHSFCERSDLPEFDFICLHGIWSWISPENRAAIVKLIDSKLRVGGCVYLSYNTNPGWAAFRPLRDLMKFYLDTQVSPAADISAKVKNSFEFAEQLLGLDPVFLQQNPHILNRLMGFKDRDTAYLAHEFLNDDWDPVGFADLTKTLAEAKLAFACPANPARSLFTLHLNETQNSFLNQIQDPVLWETVKDFLLNTQFRKDYWLKGPRKLTPFRRNQLLREESFVLLTPVSNLPREIKTSSGNVIISETAYKVIIQVLRDGHPHTLAEMENMAPQIQSQSNPDTPPEDISSLAQVMAVLIDTSYVATVQKPQSVKAAIPSADRLNAFLENFAIDNGFISNLASPLTGGGLPINRFTMLFLLALRNGANNIAACAAYALEYLNQAAQYILDDGKPLTEKSKALGYLNKQAEFFWQQQLPILKTLLIA